MTDVIRLRKGNRLFHGTPTATRFRVLKGPAWFSDHASVAEWFAVGLPRFLGDEPASPRIIEYRVKKSPTLLVFRDELALGKFARSQGYPRETRPGFYRAAIAMCAEHDADGWIVRDVYDPQEPGADFMPRRGTGAVDLMLCHPPQFVERVGVSHLARSVPSGAV